MFGGCDNESSTNGLHLPTAMIRFLMEYLNFKKFNVPA